MSYVDPKKCKDEDCKNTYIPHKWGQLRSQRENWFHQKNGDSWCPDHIPGWVAKWRANKSPATERTP